MRAKLEMVKQEMRRRMHQPIPDQGKWLGTSSAATSTTTQCRRTLGHSRHSGTEIARRWRQVLIRRSQKDESQLGADEAAD